MHVKMLLSHRIWAVSSEQMAGVILMVLNKTDPFPPIEEPGVTSTPASLWATFEHLFLDEIKGLSPCPLAMTV